MNEDRKELILQHAQEEYPNECCGIILGLKNERKVLEIVKTYNVDTEYDKNVHFAINPLLLYKVERESEKRGLDVIGFYHSHIDYPAVLSKEDERYMIPGCIYAIASVNDEKCNELRLYYKDSFDEDYKDVTDTDYIKWR